jgi:hypothetical protein
MAGWSTQNRQGGRENKPRIYEQMDFYEFPPNKWVEARQLGPIHSYAEAWMKVRKNDGTISGSFPKICLDYNPKTQNFDRNTKKDKNGKRKVVSIDPWRKGGLYVAQKFISNFIIRSLQKNEPARKPKLTKSERKVRDMLGEKWHIKEMGSESWTPCRVIPIPSTLAEQLAALEELNVHNGKAYPLHHPKYGMDVKIRYNPKAAGSAKWNAQVSKKTRLKENEKEYLIYDLVVSALEPETQEEAERNWDSLKDRIVLDEKKEDKNKKSRKKSREDDDDEDLEEKPKKNKKKSVKSSKPSKSSKISNKKKKKQNYDDDLDDFDV